ncbi:MAG: F0F1 ATP synthase subunit epsilon [Planctomycetes bacterium]|nr:F0F1 ATP synthase subunit epsilon [Planctomycetota bacterium]
MAGELTLRVITPDRIVVDEPVESVQVPALDGSMGILPRHAPMVAALQVGVLRYKAKGGEKVLFVSEGFAEVRGNVLRVVCEAGETAGEIDEARARDAEKRARERLAKKGNGGGAAEFDAARAEAALHRAMMRLRVLEYGSRERVRT